MYVWHRRTATAGALLIPLHLALLAVRPGRSQPGGTAPASPLGNALGALALVGLLVLVLLAFAARLRVLARVLAYQRWFVAHRFIGIFVLAATVHGLLVDPILRDNSGLMTVYTTVGLLGTLAYLQRELIAPWRRTDSPYLVAGIDRLDDSTLDVRLLPVEEPLSFRAGQFVFISFGGIGGWQSHPFTVASAPSDPTLRLSIRTLGDHTAALHCDLSPGTPARLSGPHGMFDHELGGPKQIWIAGGIGITPFLSWLRDSPLHADREVRLYHTVPSRGDCHFTPELTETAQRRDWLSFTPVHSDVDGRLTVERIVDDCGGTVTGFDVFICGPAAMTESFREEFRKRGLGTDAIHSEHFNFR